MLLVLVWFLGPGLVSLAISIVYFVILLSIAFVVIVLVYKLVFDDALKKTTVENHFHGLILQVVSTKFLKSRANLNFFHVYRKKISICPTAAFRILVQQIKTTATKIIERILRLARI